MLSKEKTGKRGWMWRAVGLSVQLRPRFCARRGFILGLAMPVSKETGVVGRQGQNYLSLNLKTAYLAIHQSFGINVRSALSEKNDLAQQSNAWAPAQILWHR